MDISRGSIETHLKAGFSNVEFHFGKGGDVLGIDELVPVHPAGFMEPQSDQVHRGLKALGS